MCFLFWTCFRSHISGSVSAGADPIANARFSRQLLAPTSVIPAIRVPRDESSRRSGEPAIDIVASVDCRSGPLFGAEAPAARVAWHPWWRWPTAAVERVAARARHGHGFQHTRQRASAQLFRRQRVKARSFFFKFSLSFVRRLLRLFRLSYLSFALASSTPLGESIILFWAFFTIVWIIISDDSVDARRLLDISLIERCQYPAMPRFSALNENSKFQETRAQHFQGKKKQIGLKTNGDERRALAKRCRVSSVKGKQSLPKLRGKKFGG